MLGLDMGDWAERVQRPRGRRPGNECGESRIETEHIREMGREARAVQPGKCGVSFRGRRSERKPGEENDTVCRLPYSPPSSRVFSFGYYGYIREFIRVLVTLTRHGPTRSNESVEEIWGRLRLAG